MTGTVRVVLGILNSVQLVICSQMNDFKNEN